LGFISLCAIPGYFSATLFLTADFSAGVPLPETRASALRA
jgi:hypothetical protein